MMSKEKNRLIIVLILVVGFLLLVIVWVGIQFHSLCSTLEATREQNLILKESFLTYATLVKKNEDLVVLYKDRARSYRIVLYDLLNKLGLTKKYYRPEYSAIKELVKIETAGGIGGPEDIDRKPK
jgi:hypothetical protein